MKKILAFILVVGSFILFPTQVNAEGVDEITQVEQIAVVQPE